MPVSLQVLAAFLLYELSRGAESFWYPYLRSLPTSYTCLSYFSAEEAEQLQVSMHRLLSRAFQVLPCLLDVRVLQRLFAQRYCMLLRCTWRVCISVGYR